MVPDERQAHADALHLILAGAEDEIIEHDSIRATLIGKLAADAIAAGDPGTKTQLPDTTFIPDREKRLEKVLAANLGTFWGQMTTAIKFQFPNPKARPDDATRLQRVETLLTHPLLGQVLEKEGELKAKLLRFGWVTPEEIETEQIQKLLAK